MLGHNGAGKSSIMRALLGLLPVWEGRIALAGRDLTGEPPWRRVHAGPGVSLQDQAVFPTMTVQKNLLLGGYVHGRDTRRVEAQLERALQIFPILRAQAKQLAWTLSGGERRMLSVGMALMADPRLLLLDGPSTGLSPRMTGEVPDTIHQIRDTLGTSALLIEQNVQQTLAWADHVLVLKTGALVYDGQPALLSSDPTELVRLF